tara:strand:+ start:523 stop:1731 length:1209 start_codon:yes stop_codon:yes gene_type:complete
MFEVECKYWSRGNAEDGGLCQLGLFGGSPSFGVCINHCDKYHGPKLTSQQILEETEKGLGFLPKTKGLAEAVKRQGARLMKGQPLAVSGDEAERRWNICKACPTGQFQPKGDSKGSCKVCGCGMHRKVRWASEWCPDGHWGKDDTTCVLISATINEQHLNETIEQVQKSARGQVEFRTQYDTSNEGLRVILNRLSMQTRAKYLMKLDAHCTLSDGWDEQMKAECSEGTLVFPSIVGMNDKFELTGHRNGPAYLNSDLVEKWWNTEHTNVRPAMANTGCGLFMHRSDFEKLGRFDTQLGRYGGLGPETSLKFWLSGGKLVYHPGVVCGHIYKRKPDHDTTVQDLQDTYARIRHNTHLGLWPEQKHHIGWLVGKFDPVPTWDKTMIWTTQPSSDRVEWVSEYYS